MIVKRKALNRIKDVMWALAFAGLVAGVGRFVFGLGASTNMMDSLPWGWWKIFNMVAGAALATSGFVVAAIIYILQLERYRPVARLSVLVGFFGYGSSLVALIFDIGLPHRGWHPFFMWNPHSFLFEVFWCVSIYWGVTALELLPIITERFPLHRFTHWLHEKILPVVVLGITLSTMHHSSLGSLFMASPTRLHPLWHSLWIPPEFFISAMGAGLSTIILLIIATSWLFGRERDSKALNGLAIGSAIFLGLYLILKIADFTVNRKWNFVFGPDLSWETMVFYVEISLQAIIPVLIFSIPRMRRSLFGLGVAASSAFFGLIMHRLDTGIVGYFRSSEAVYIPNISEFVLSFGVLSAAGLGFLFLIEKFYVLEEPDEKKPEDPDDEEAHAEPDVQFWSKAELWALLTGEGAQRVARILIISVPLAFFAFRSQATGAFKPIPQPVSDAVLAGDTMRTLLRLDGNRNGMATAFGHDTHKKAFQTVYGLEEKQTCAKCHHLSLPNDTNTSCRRCHSDMELDTPMFDLEKHRPRFNSDEQLEAFLELEREDKLIGYGACAECHANAEMDKALAPAILSSGIVVPGLSGAPPVDLLPGEPAPNQKAPMKGLTFYARKGFAPSAPGFMHAMHGSCLECHRMREQQKKEDPAKPTSRGNCLYCHRDWADPGMFDTAEMAAYDAGTLSPDEKATLAPAIGDGQEVVDGADAPRKGKGKGKLRGKAKRKLDAAGEPSGARTMGSPGGGSEAPAAD